MGGKGGGSSSSRIVWDEEGQGKQEEEEGVNKGNGKIEKGEEELQKEKVDDL